MKKSLLALAVAAVAATSFASTASATTVYDKDGTSLGVYGRVQSVFYSDDASGVTDDNGKGKSSINTSARLGVDLRSQISNNVAGFALAEWEAANGNNAKDVSDSFDARLLWVGLDFGQYGKIKVGKFEEAIKYSLYATDIFEDYGCLGYAGNDDRREGVVMYQWSGSGIDALVSYAFAKDNEQLDGAYLIKENADLKYSVSAALGYTSPDVIFGPIAIRAGFIQGEFDDATKNSRNTFGYVTTPGTNTTYATVGYDKYQQFAIGASWGNLNLGPYIGVQYQARKFDLVALTDVVNYAGASDYTVSGFEVAAGYSFANGVLVRTGYQTQEVDYGGDIGDSKGAAIPVFALWNLNSQVQLWAEARFDAGTDESKNGGKNFATYTNSVFGNINENVFSAGLRYNF